MLRKDYITLGTERVEYLSAESEAHFREIFRRYGLLPEGAPLPVARGELDGLMWQVLDAQAEEIVRELGENVGAQGRAVAQWGGSDVLRMLADNKRSQVAPDSECGTVIQFPGRE